MSNKKLVSELEGVELDYWAGKAAGFSDRELVIGNRPGSLSEKYVVVYGVNVPGTSNHCGPKGHGAQTWSPSTNWEQGGPIIERETIRIEPLSTTKGDVRWGACHLWKNTGTWYRGEGDRLLVVAMRCFVASKFGEYVEDIARG